MFWLTLALRWMHILAAITAVGGTIFARFVVLPSQEVLSAEQRTALHAAMRQRWSKLVMASIGLLLLSGLTNFILAVKHDQLDKPYHMLFGIKFLIAMVIFLVASLLSGRTAAADKIRQNAKFWMNLNITLAIVLVCISGYLRTLHGPKKGSAEDRTAISAPDR